VIGGTLMGKGKVVRRLALIGSAIAGAVFFWRKRQAHEGRSGDEPPSAGEAAGSSSGNE
jgi:hypothetical protein